MEVDSFGSGKLVPGFELELKWTDRNKTPVLLDHPLTLHGAKGESYFTIYISDPGMTTIIDQNFLNDQRGLGR